LVYYLAEIREAKRHERARLALLRARHCAEPLRSMQQHAEDAARESWVGVCNAYRSYANG
jgi:hypothetical protein